MKTSVNWIENLHLEGETDTGHTVPMDSSPLDMTYGPTPKELVLQGLAGCTMMDVISILKKQRKDIEKFFIDVDAELATEHPKVFTKVNIGYNFTSSNLDDETARKAIELSREKYCAVYNMLNKAAEITYTLHIKRTE
ncbi:MAG: OsmC family protein [Ignavibacteria bacterium]